MLPAREDIVIIIVVVTTDMVTVCGGTVVVHRSALILRIQILHDHVVQPSDLLQLHLRTQHDILEVVGHITVAHPLIPLLSPTIAVVVEHEHRRVVVEEMIGIHT